MNKVKHYFWTWLACLVVFLGGISASFSLGSRLEDDANAHWIGLARSEINKITEVTLFQLSQVSAVMHAIEAEFTNSESLSDELMLEILFNVEGWNLHFAPKVIAYVDRVMRDERQDFEAAHGTVATVLEPDVRAPDSFEAFVVTHSSNMDRLLRQNMDMMTYPDMKSVVMTASRVPEQVIIGPAFRWIDGENYSVVGLSSEQNDLDGVVVGLLDLDELYEGLVNVYIPEGIVLRMYEREGDDAAQSSLSHVLGPEAAREDTVETITIRFTEGQARWELYWDVLPEFNAGPDTGLATTAKYGGAVVTILFTLFLAFLINRNMQISDVVRKRTNELNTEKERLRLALKGGDLGSWDVDLRTGETLYNARWADTLGYHVEEVQNARELWRETIHPDDKDRVFEIGRKYRAGEIDSYEIEYRIVTKDNEVRWVQTKGEATEFDDNGMVARMSGVMSDITARKEIEKQVDYQRKLLRALTNNIPHYVCMTDTKGKYQFTNKTFEEWMCVGHAEYVDKTIYDLFSPEEAEIIRERDLNTIKSGQLETEEIDYLYPDGVERTVIMMRFPIKDASDTVVGLGNINFDISERKQMEAELQEAKSLAEKANQAKSDFLASMSHELRTPLNAIIGFSQLMEYNPDEPLSDTQKENIGYIQSGGQHLLSLINDILDLAKIEAGKADMAIEDVVILSVIDECQALISTLAEKRGITLEIKQEQAEGVSVKADNVRLNQVLLNLLSNAVKYNREKGSITVGFEKRSNGKLRISVTDTGEGIPEEKAGELFKPFSRLGAENTDIEGTGIGLVVTKELVERMGGAIGFYSEPGTGSTFWIELPMTGKAAESKSETQQDRTEQVNRLEGVSGKLLYVEDDALHAKLLEALVTASSDIDVTIAPDGQSALDMVEHLDPDVIFLDIKLPDMSGYDVIKHLREHEKTRGTRIYALTVAATEEDMQVGLDAGFTGYLTKPLQFEEITDAILESIST